VNTLLNSSKNKHKTNKTNTKQTQNKHKTNKTNTKQTKQTQNK